MVHDPSLDITYPCTWGYTVIGPCEASLRVAIAVVVGDAEHSVEMGNTSRSGRYVSLRLSVVVTSDGQRQSIHRALARHPEVRVVL
jgi:putative lipoic acid-binding regulatory protein